MSANPLNLERGTFNLWFKNPLHWPSLFFFILEKLSYKVKLKRIPLSIKLAKMNLRWEESTKFKIPNSDLIIPQSSNSVIEIHLASKSYLVDISQNKEIDFNENFSDSEDSESLHRWGWGVFIFNDGVSEEVIAWAEKQFLNWIKKYKNSKTGDAWEAYTISERISNAIFFYEMTNRQMPEVVIDHLVHCSKVLCNKLEYHGKYTGNHVFNNAKALFIISQCLKNSSLENFSFLIMKRELPRLINQYGYLREGSSHYHLLFTKWLLEIFYIANKFNNTKVTEYISEFISKAMPHSQQIIAEYEHYNSAWGDISPDINPELLVKRFLSLREKVIVQFRNISENGFFKRLVTETQYLKMRFENNLPPKHVGHHHVDLFHFDYFYNGKAIFTDTGRKSYSCPISGVSAQYHNSITVNGLGAWPIKRFSFPQMYSNFNMTMKELSNKSLNIESSCFSRVIGTSMFSRNWQLREEGFEITDSISSRKNSFSLETYFHFATGVEILLISDRKFKIVNGLVSGLMLIEGGFDIRIEIIESERVFSYGRSQIAKSLFITQNINRNVTIKYVVTWDSN